MKHLTRSHHEKLELASAIAEYLNTLIRADAAAMNELFENRVLCNEALVAHPTAQVTVDSPYRIGLLGVINGIIGVDAGSWGYLAGEYDDDGRLTHVVLRRSGCRACQMEAEIGTEELPHPIDPRAHTCLEVAQEAAKTDYVVGFYFDQSLTRVALITKARPLWQAGKLNGIGGKVEKGEPVLTAMRREFNEETGLMIGRFRWKHFMRLELYNDAGNVDYFWAQQTTTDDCCELRTMDPEEPVDWYMISDVLSCYPSGKHAVVANTPWALIVALNDVRELDSCTMHVVRENTARV